MALIVLHHHHQIIHASEHFGKDRVGRKRAFGVDSGVPRFGHGRGNFLIILGAEQTALSVVRV